MWPSLGPGATVYTTLLCPGCRGLLRTGEEAEPPSHPPCFSHPWKWSLIPHQPFHPRDFTWPADKRTQVLMRLGKPWRCSLRYRYQLLCKIFIPALIASGFTVPLSQNQPSDRPYDRSPILCVLGTPKAPPLWEIHQDSYGCTHSSD